MNHIQVFEDDENDLVEDDILAIDYIGNGIPRKVHNRKNPFYGFDENEFFIRFRLSKASVYDLLTFIEDRLEFPYDKNYSVSPINQLLVCLRVFATGGHLQSIADFSGMQVSTVSRIVVRISKAIASLSRTHIRFPSTCDEIRKCQNEFYEISSFPRVVGVIDCTHIRIQSPGGNIAGTENHIFQLTYRSWEMQNTKLLILLLGGQDHLTILPFSGSEEILTWIYIQIPYF